MKYFLSAWDLFDPNYKKITQEGNTRLYEIQDFLPRAFFVDHTIETENKNQTIVAMFDQSFSATKSAVIENGRVLRKNWSEGEVKITNYQPNEVVLETSNDGAGFLVLTDNFYPSWRVSIDGLDTTIYLTDYAFRGIVVPAGNHVVKFYL